MQRKLPTQFKFTILCRDLDIQKQNEFLEFLGAFKLIRLGGSQAKEQLINARRNGVPFQSAISDYFCFEGDISKQLRSFAKKDSFLIRSELFPVAKVISGGQTGVDQAALDVAIERKIPHGGWCPLGRASEVGKIPEKYQLQETSSDDPAERTEKNIIEADGTLIFTWGQPFGSTLHTINRVATLEKEYMVIDFRVRAQPKEVLRWIQKHQINVLNVAGPRQSQIAQAYETTFKFLSRLFIFESD